MYFKNIIKTYMSEDILTHYLKCAGFGDVDPSDFRRQRRIVLVPRDHWLRISDSSAY